MDKKPDETRITVRLPLPLLEGLRRLARRDHRSVNGEVVSLIQAYIERRVEEEVMMREREIQKREYEARKKEQGRDT